MEQIPYFVSLDIGTTKIAAIVGRRNEMEKLEILGHGVTESLGVKRGAVQNLDSTTESIKKAIAQAKAASGVDIKEVYVGIAGQHIRSIEQPGVIIRRNNKEVISQKELDQLQEDMYNINIRTGEKIIDVIPQEYTVDDETGITAPSGMFGNKIDATYHIIIGEESKISNILKCVKDAGLKGVGLTLEPIASAAAVLSEEDKELGVVLVDIGGGTTDVAIFYKNIIRHTKVIPIGGGVITDDIQQGLCILNRQAELLKTQYGSALEMENAKNQIVTIPGTDGRPSKEIFINTLACIIQHRVKNIMEGVLNEIKYSHHSPTTLGGGIVLTGGGALLQNIAQYTQFITGMQVRIGYPNKHLAHNQKNENTLSNPIYATGVGLLIEGYERYNKTKVTENKSDVINDTANNDTDVPKKKRKGWLTDFADRFFGDEPTIKK